MRNRELHTLSTRLAAGVRETGTGVECEGNAFVDYVFEAYWEHNHYFVEWDLQPKDPGHSIWFAQSGIESIGSGAVGSTAAFQAGVPGTAPAGMGVFLHATDRNIRPGMMLRLSVTGYVKVGGDPHKQFCFRFEQPAD